VDKEKLSAREHVESEIKAAFSHRELVNKLDEIERQEIVEKLKDHCIQNEIPVHMPSLQVAAQLQMEHDEEKQKENKESADNE